jgi:hypothetical protein
LANENLSPYSLSFLMAQMNEFIVKRKNKTAPWGSAESAQPHQPTNKTSMRWSTIKHPSAQFGAKHLVFVPHLIKGLKMLIMLGFPNQA